MKIGIINGPNLNLLGVREPQIYGNQGFESFMMGLEKSYPEIMFTYFQSNVEGELINALQKMGSDNEAILFNPGGYTHTSVALGDTIAAIRAPVIEIHISNVAAREDFRKISHVSAKCLGTISGLGLNGYVLGIEYFLRREVGGRRLEERR